MVEWALEQSLGRPFLHFYSGSSTDWVQVGGVQVGGSRSGRGLLSDSSRGWPFLLLNP